MACAMARIGEAVRRPGIPDAKPPKYGNRKTVVNGITFDSVREAKRWGELLILQRIGEIRDLDRQQPIFMFGEKDAIRTPTGKMAKYVADFVYTDCKTGAWTIEDAKGFRTPEYKLKRAILAAMGLTIKEV
jgi:Protein of unknown function (DUF1064)